MINKETKIIQYNREEYPFRSLIEQIFNTTSLENLHKNAQNNYEVFNEMNDHKTEFHKKFYENNQQFLDLYNKFIKEWIKPILFDNEMIVYQTKPSFRICIPENVAVGSWHRDRDFGHDTNEMNFWLPFTNTNTQNTVWIESEEGKEDFKPYIVQYGEILIFDGPSLKHGNQINKSEESRVSVDFRIIPFSQFKQNKNISISNHTKFEIGGYWSII